MASDKSDVLRHLEDSEKALERSKKLLKRPRDPLQLAKLIGDIATGAVEDRTEDNRDQAARELGQKGGQARARNLSDEKRREIARKAAAKRWGK